MSLWLLAAILSTGCPLSSVRKLGSSLKESRIKNHWPRLSDESGANAPLIVPSQVRGRQSQRNCKPPLSASRKHFVFGCRDDYLGLQVISLRIIQTTQLGLNLAAVIRSAFFPACSQELERGSRPPKLLLCPQVHV
ncbi:uncharacterized protein B0H18DRAFT_198573 [Fomitopsis serialis]|uniref:uncharacterized protein n=1 Tax=Fomitopsis serialis TaxID=139415 RepID=UPI0020082875|nr:uncharacterized protein B0H18DRAFT_198573 [Neoantrodia serialis]KAH9937458.1 hypothetical protein B0H18DRAFT_198573 [Neoantrodia serialis]